MAWRVSSSAAAHAGQRSPTLLERGAARWRLGARREGGEPKSGDASRVGRTNCCTAGGRARVVLNGHGNDGRESGEGSITDGRTERSSPRGESMHSQRSTTCRTWRSIHQLVRGADVADGGNTPPPRASAVRTERRVMARSGRPHARGRFFLDGQRAQPVPTMRAGACENHAHARARCPATIKPHDHEAASRRRSTRQVAAR